MQHPSDSPHRNAVCFVPCRYKKLIRDSLRQKLGGNLRITYITGFRSKNSATASDPADVVRTTARRSKPTESESTSRSSYTHTYVGVTNSDQRSPLSSSRG
ncbi:hypothetical protein Trydic_g17507 [Trypoxylus dichotomus]